MLTSLKALRDAYPRVIWFNGHSHWKWYLQNWEEKANVWPLTNVNRTSAWCVHIPSCAYPIDSSVGNSSLSSTRVSMPNESEGAIIDVYEDYIDIRAIVFKDTGDTDYSKKYIPIGQYRLYTEPETETSSGGDSGTETPTDDSVYVTTSMISTNTEKAGGESFTVDDDTHTLTITFTAKSQGVLFTDGSLTGSETVKVYFDEVTYSQTLTDTAKTYIGIYNGSNYDNTSGVTAGLSSTYPGIQFNSSSRFSSNGGSFPVTITYTNLRYKVIS
jgi:hypothetical protein